MAVTLQHSVWACDIDNLCHWFPESGTWRRYLSGDSNAMRLRIYQDFLLITHSDKAVESLNLLMSKIKGFIKGSIMILAISSQDKSVRKIKFQMLCSPEEMATCVSRLSQFLPVEDRNTKQVAGKHFRSMDEILKQILAKGDGESLPQMPTPYKDFVRLCVLDPGFSQLVSETENIINNFM